MKECFSVEIQRQRKTKKWKWLAMFKFREDARGFAGDLIACDLAWRVRVVKDER